MPQGRQTLTLGEHLRRDRGERPAREVADAVGVSVSQLYRYENDELEPPDETLIALALCHGDRSLLERHPVPQAIRSWPLAA